MTHCGKAAYPSTRIARFLRHARHACLLLCALVGGCAGPGAGVPVDDGTMRKLMDADNALAQGRARDVVIAADDALARADLGSTMRVRWLVLRAKGRLELGELARARVDARTASFALADAFSDEAGARGIWQVEIERLLQRIDARGRAAPVPRVASTPPRTAPAAPAVAATSGPPIESRTRWRARAMKANRDPMTRIDRVTVHHSGTVIEERGYAGSADAILAIQRHHQDANGWADIGYHFVVDRSGRIWEGRPLEWQGAHAGSNALNRGNIGVVLLGAFDRQALTDDQRRALITLLDHLRARHRIAASGVYTHRELKPTECPGSALSAEVDRYRSRGLLSLL